MKHLANRRLQEIPASVLWADEFEPFPVLAARHLNRLLRMNAISRHPVGTGKSFPFQNINPTKHESR